MVNMKPGTWGTLNGKPVIVWWRHGCAELGEPSIVEKIVSYMSESERLDAYQKYNYK